MDGLRIARVSLRHLKPEPGSVQRDCRGFTGACSQAQAIEHSAILCALRVFAGSISCVRRSRHNVPSLTSTYSYSIPMTCEACDHWPSVTSPSAGGARRGWSWPRGGRARFRGQAIEGLVDLEPVLTRAQLDSRTGSRTYLAPLIDCLHPLMLPPGLLQARGYSLLLA
jgi:hypothetical protein